ncbi:LysR family transcriptional regulator [Paraburkholderia caffeinilytica]|uniref:LysR family transcriptional regulator n=1 Tax=Paraburkholderia caffeinilytica TaxID=1761016 RepID=A0ABQ1LF29_9BURK|nr:LysR family transcriptional regulator [Paraburkholderia caffeinilytica]GGC23236.1 LysR family transcriptional regulator [Paraburkholderia caffeinilytica]CAB3777172.1 HTH-type transcriptional regulator GltC [Paraburkholderia caffeinilytica]
MLNLSRLHLLHELSVLGTVSAVAEAVHLTRPAVSQQLALLEEELETVLIERSGRGVQLTPAGRRLVARSTDLFQIVEEIEAEVAAANVEVSGEVRISAFGSLASSVVPLAIRQLLEDHPRLNVIFTELEPAEGLRAAAAKQTDLAIVDDLVSAEALANVLEFRPLCVDHFDAVVSANHKLAGRKSIQLPDLAHERWALNQSAAAYHAFILNACYAGGFTPKVTTSSRNMAVTLEMVRTGCTVAVLPRLALRQAEKDPDFAVIPIDPVLNRRVFVALPKGSAKRPAVAAVLDALTIAASEPE